MPGLELSTAFDPQIDRISQKIQQIKDRSAQKQDNAMDGAMDVVEQNVGREAARVSHMSLQSLGAELSAQEAAIHHLDPLKVADLISDPFDD